MKPADRARLDEMRAEAKESPLCGDGYPAHWSDQEIAEFRRLERAKTIAAILRGVPVMTNGTLT